jgi:hypothetical protein
MKRVILCITVVVVLTSISYAQEEVKATREYIPLAKGNFWEYKITGEVREEGNCKLEIVEEIGKDKFRVNPTGILFVFIPGLTEFCIEGDFFWWKTLDGPASVVVRMLKLGAKKGDSWTTSVNLPNVKLPPMVWNSTIVGLEEVSTPAGVFKDCLKVVHSTSIGRDTGSDNVWFAKGVGIVKITKSAPDGTVFVAWTLTKYKVVRSTDAERISKYLGESETALLVKVTSMTDVKPEKEGEAVTKVKVAAKVEKSLKGKSSQTELSLEMASGSIKVGKFVLFFKKGEKGDVILGEPVEATEANLKAIEEILNPPKFADTISDSSLIIAGKVITCEDRGTFKYYVVEVIKVFKGEKKEFIDVLKTEDFYLENGKTYLFALKPTVVSGRNYFEPAVRRGAVVIHSEEAQKQIEEALKNQKEK